jgi:murein DD-endopeptidase MepM/ murein hydrolase activator NlpD
MSFPLPFVPKASWHFNKAGHKRYFGAPREGGRIHAACDLIAKVGTEIVAIDDGVVYEISPSFLQNTSAVAVRHRGGFIVRYCEVEKSSISKLSLGTTVKQGEVIARVGQLRHSAMLHFELYAGTKLGPLTAKGNAYKRRADLLNPTALLDRLACHVLVCEGPVALPPQTAQSIK